MSTAGYMREYLKDPENKAKHLARVKEYQSKNKDKMKTHTLRWNFKNKELAMNALGGTICRKCKITDIRVLTINHINGHQQKQALRIRESGQRLYRDIINKLIKTEELEVLCYNCNILYEYERGTRKLSPIKKDIFI